MAIFKRLSKLASSKKTVNKEYDEEINQLLKFLQDEIAKIKLKESKMEAEKIRIQRELDECTEEIRKMEDYIERAKQSGNGDTRVFVSKKTSLEDEEKTLKNTYEKIKKSSTFIKETHDNLTFQMSELISRKHAIDSKIEKAKIQQIINQLNSESFCNMEERANRMIDEAEAMAELNEFERGI